MFPSGRVLQASCKHLMVINGLFNEKSEFKKIKLYFLFFNFYTLSNSLTLKKYYGALYHSEGLEISNFLVYHMLIYLVYQQRYDRFSTTDQDHVFSSPL